MSTTTGHQHEQRPVGTSRKSFVFLIMLASLIVYNLWSNRKMSICSPFDQEEGNEVIQLQIQKLETQHSQQVTQLKQKISSLMDQLNALKKKDESEELQQTNDKIQQQQQRHLPKQEINTENKILTSQKLESSTTIDQQKETHPCQNKDFQPPKHKIAITSFITDMKTESSGGGRRGDYTYGAAALIKSIQKYVPENTVDTILLEIPGKHSVSDRDRHYLQQQLGWNVCTIKPIEAKHKPFGRFIDQFNKLRIWSFVEYEKIIYLDSDALVVGNIDALLSKSLGPGKMIGVTRDYFGIRFVNTFNMGVFVIHPNITEYQRLVLLHDTDAVPYTTHQAEQGFLNAVYKDQWEEIGIEYNANMAVWAQKRTAWPSDPRILHFTLEKPWQEKVPISRVRSEEPMDNFLNVWIQAAIEYGVWDKQQTATEDNHIHGACLNKDFRSNKKKAIFTLLIPKEEKYVLAARVLGASIRIQTNAVDTVVLELSTHPLSNETWKQLQAAGWSHKCTISPIRPQKRPSPRFIDQFSKLHVWGMVNYDTAIYLDSDTFVMGNIDQLVDIKIDGTFKMGVTRDYRMDYKENPWASSFNMGVFVIHPSWDEYQYLLQFQQHGVIPYEEVMAEQGWLNAVYKDKWKEIGLVYNANVAARFDEKFTSKQNDLRIIHYTTMKPWFGKTDPLCQSWAQLRDKIVANQIDYTGQ